MSLVGFVLFWTCSAIQPKTMCVNLTQLTNLTNFLKYDQKLYFCFVSKCKRRNYLVPLCKQETNHNYTLQQLNNNTKIVK